MQRLLALLTALLLLFSCCAAAEEFTDETEAEEPALTALEIALLGRPVSDEPTHVTVGNTTKVSGSFFTTYFGNNTSDIDVRAMLHGYNPIVWESQVEFITDPQVVEDLQVTQSGGNTVYTVTLQQDLTYSDGETKITAADYVFSMLLCASKELTGIGAATGPFTDVVGYEEYHSGENDNYTGIRLLGDYRYSVTVKGTYEPYFYELAYLSINPYPISVLAPGCKVADDGKGAYITNEDETLTEPLFTSELLYQTILAPDTGYASYPMLTTGPYRLVSYDKEAGEVEFELNPYFKGNFEGVKPIIDTVTLVPVLPENMVDMLANGEVDLLNKCVDGDVINAAMQLVGTGYTMLNYARLGYGFCALSCEQGPQQFQAVRQALAYAFDADTFNRDFLQGYGMNVYGYYGLGQWMLYAAMGTLRPEEMTDEEAAAWDALTLDTLNPYTYDLEAAKQLLIEDGWTLNENGEAFDETRDSVRYKQVDGELMRLSFHFAQTIGNDAAQQVVDMYNESLPQIGAELDVEMVTFGQLLQDYYREDGKREFDMNFMATNFVSTFDPYMVFSGDHDYQGSVNTSGLYDEELVKLSWEMRSTEPLDLLTYEQRWIKMQERFNEVLPTLPIYSNVYFDFHTDWLQNYYANSETNWPIAILYAYYAEPVVDETLTDDMFEDDTFVDDTETDAGEEIFID